MIFMADEKPAEDIVLEEAVEAPAEDKAEDKKVEEPKAEEPKVEIDLMPEDSPAEGPKEEAKPEAEPKEEPPAAEEPKEEPPAAEEPSKEEPKEEQPVVEKPEEEKPKKEKKEAPKKEEPAEDKPEEPAPAEGAEDAPAEKPKGPKKAIGLPHEKVLLFGKYNMSEVVVQDPGLEKYLNLEPIIVAHTGARHANRSFAKTKMHIIERLVNNMMRTEKYTGKKTKSYTVVRDALEIVEKKTKKHPVQILVEAIENSAPREEVTRLRYGGISVPKAVDTSSSRRLDIAFRNITKGAVTSSYKTTKAIEVCLANEIMLAAKGDMNSFAVSKKEELERVAASAR